MDQNRAAKARLSGVDIFRGLAIMLMLPANYLAGIVWIPAWLKHAPDAGLTVIDLIAPFFIFAIGLTYRPALLRRAAREGWFSAARHVITRNLALIGLGAILSAGETAVGMGPAQWGVLQAIGVAGLLALPLARRGSVTRLLAGMLLLALYQVLLDASGWSAWVLTLSHGGLPGSLGWTGMLLLATVLADLYHDPVRRRRMAWVAFLLLLAGVGMAVLGVVVSKNRVSSSYVLVSLAASAGLFLLVDWLARRGVGRVGALLAAWGRNPLLLYVLHLILLGLVVLPDLPAWYSQAAPWLAAAQLGGLLALLSAVALWLDRRGMYFSL